MTNPMFNPQPNYSGVTIQITNPSVNTGQYDGRAVQPCINSGYVTPCIQNGYAPLNTQGNYINYPQATYLPYAEKSNLPDSAALQQSGTQNPIQNTGYPTAYPAQYYLNNYNYAEGNDKADSKNNTPKQSQDKFYPQAEQNIPEINPSDNNSNINTYKIYAQGTKQNNNDLTKSQNIIGDIAEREAEIEEEKKNTKETKIVALTDEYIKSLENYLNNPNDEIRLMASKEILTRLDEDKDRYDDAALNALLNKMMQDPNKLVRIAALSAFSSQLASGNDYTVKLLHNIQSNPNSDKEDVLQAADILLKMSAGVEVKNIPNPSVKDKKEQ